MDCESDSDMGQDRSYVVESKDEIDVVGHSTIHARRKQMRMKGERRKVHSMIMTRHQVTGPRALNIIY